MTWARAIARGRGKSEYRLEIEGWPDQWVTHREMCQTLADGRRRRHGLTRKGLRIRDASILHEAKIEADGLTAKIIDVRELATESLSTLPTVIGWLTASAVAGAGNFNVSASAAFVDGYYHIGTEVVLVSARPSGTSIDVTRAQWGTTAQAHYVEVGARAVQPEFTDRPALMVGRRAFLYGYGAGDPKTGNGTLIWRGVVAAEPRANGPAWHIPIDSIASVLEQTIVGLDDPLRPRGVYYPWNAPLRLGLFEKNGTTSDAGNLTTAEILYTGFTETNVEFAAAVNALIAAATGSWASTIRVVTDGDDGWHITVTTDSGTPRYAGVSLMSGSSVDGAFDNELTDGSGIGTEVVSGGVEYYQFPQGGADGRPLGSVPRRSVPGGTSPHNTADETASSTAPANRLHLENVGGLGVGDGIEINPEGDFPQTFDITVVDTAESYVEVDMPAGTGRGPGGLVLVPPIPDLRGAIRFGSGPGDLEDFRDALIAKAVDANTGGVPHVIATDFESWNVVVAMASAGRPLQSLRQYIFSSSAELAEILEHEFRLLGVYPYITTTGTIGLRLLRVPAPTEDSTTIGASRYLVKQAFATLETHGMGAANVVVLKTGYDRVEDKFKGPTYEVRYVAAISRTRKRRVLEIAPKIEPRDPITDYSVAVDVAWPVLQMFGTRYDIVTFRCSIAAFGVTVGDVVALTIPHVPFDGERGLDDVIGTVVAREWDLDQGVGQLSVMLHTLNVAGYTPTGRVVSQSNVSGNTWDITLEANRYAPSGTDASRFAALDAAAVHEWDVASPTRVEGIVQSVVGNVVRVTFDGAWTPGASTWNLIYDNASEWTDSQERYAQIASSTRLLSDGSRARVFG